MIVTDMETWLLDNSGRLFRFWVYKKMFTPYEQKQCFSDESVYEDETCSFAFIQEAIDLGGDWLLGLEVVYDGCLFQKSSYLRLA